MRRLVLACLIATLSAGAAHAYVTSKSNTVSVLQPSDLPAAAQRGGESMTLHELSDGSTYLYIEQQMMKRILVLDVSDPAKIRAVAEVGIEAEGAFDFERNLGDKAVLVRFRGDGHVGVMKLQRPNHPMLVAASPAVADAAFADGGVAIAQSVPVLHERVVVAAQNTAQPEVLLKVAKVEQELGYTPTGTTYLLTPDGLTVVRQLAVEREERLKMSGN